MIDHRAKVVVFPEPVTPVTSTRPLCSKVIFSITGGSSDLLFGRFRRIAMNTIAMESRCEKTFYAEPRQAGNTVRHIQFLGLREQFPLTLVHDRKCDSRISSGVSRSSPFKGASTPFTRVTAAAELSNGRPKPPSQWLFSIHCQGTYHCLTSEFATRRLLRRPCHGNAFLIQDFHANAL